VEGKAGSGEVELEKLLAEQALPVKGEDEHG
jgi:hypothetical protein